MPTNLKPTDVVIVGMGAAGGVAVLPLAQAGLDVIGLEAGTWLTPKDFAPDELRNNYRAWPQSVQKANREVPTHRPNASAPNSPRPPFHPMMNAVGGTSLHYWAQSWRLSPWDFKVVSETTRRYGASRIPAGSTVEDWPFGIEELERYYDIVEHELGVSGKAGNINGKIDRRGNIFEAPRRREYPMPPLRWTDWHEKMASAARGLGWHPFPVRRDQLAVLRGSAGCAYHGFCARGGCHVNAKGSTAVTTIPKAQKTGKVDVVTEAHVTEVNVDGNGRVTGVTYVKGSEEFFQPARVVLLAMYTYENVRTLLLSKSKAFPNGLANNHGQVGRHYMTHATGGSVQALFPMNLNNWYGLPAQGVAVDDFADDNFDHSNARLHRRRQHVRLLRSAADRRRQHEHVRQGAAVGIGVEGVRQAERRSLARRLHPENDPAVRGQLSRSRSDGERSARASGVPHHRRFQRQRAQGRRVRGRQDGAVVSRGGRDRHRPQPAGHDGAVDARVWRHAHGRQPRNKRRESLGFCARSRRTSAFSARR